SSGVVVGFDDDSGIGFMPALQVASLAAGTYYIGLSGFGDQGAGSVGTTNIFTGGNHDENFAYKLTFGFTVIPAPGALAMLGFGGALMARRRR
ncbi:PEP-CTERM sorting domain-containing protein, partial [Nodularia spumigena]|uniref:PEP-CTERM sorting domain-containing protein n=1 Tax=Nodularia spumigena TaxID=70799 RepID=UPI002B204893